MSRPKKNKSNIYILSPEEINKQDKRDQFLAIGFLIFISLTLLLTLSLPFREWCSHNLLHRPFYFLFSGSFYVSYFMMLFKIALLFLISGAILGAAAWVIISEVFKMKIAGLKRIITLVVVAVLILILFTFGNSYTKDFNLVLQGKYNTEKSYLFKIKRITSKHNKHPNLDVSVDYRLYTNTLAREYSESELKWYIESESEKSEKIFYAYNYLDLDVYQYYDLKKIHSEKSQSDSIRMKVYYLPNTKQVLRYELQD